MAQGFNLSVLDSKETLREIQIPDDQKSSEQEPIHSIMRTDVNKLVGTGLIKCFWCRNLFDTISIYIPVRIQGIIKKFGVFCSEECRMAFLLENSRQYSQSFEILRQNKENIVIQPAPSWMLLKEYGGKYTIEEFRTISKKHDRNLSENIISSGEYIEREYI
jgi:hypothetical protein